MELSKRQGVEAYERRLQSVAGIAFLGDLSRKTDRYGRISEPAVWGSSRICPYGGLRVARTYFKFPAQVRAAERNTRKALKPRRHRAQKEILATQNKAAL
jgi:hypothetical protein